MQEVEKMSCARDCADCGFLFRGGGRWWKVIFIVGAFVRCDGG
jgi:hypothetical protein